MIVLAVDPGFIESGYCYYDGSEPGVFGKINNEQMLDELSMLLADHLVIEQLKNYGMPAGDELFGTAVWSGRFIERWAAEFTMIPRKTVAGHVCGNAKAGDSNIRQALKDRYGGDSVAIGGTKCKTCKGKGVNGREKSQCVGCGGNGWQNKPGPLHAMKGAPSDVWSALALAITWWETERTTR